MHSLHVRNELVTKAVYARAHQLFLQMPLSKSSHPRILAESNGALKYSLAMARFQESTILLCNTVEAEKCTFPATCVSACGVNRSPCGEPVPHAENQLRVRSQPFRVRRTSSACGGCVPHEFPHAENCFGELSWRTSLAPRQLAKATSACLFEPAWFKHKDTKSYVNESR